MAEKLEPGWYWVKRHLELDWEPAGLFDQRWYVAALVAVSEWAPAIIGPRIEPPVDSGEG